MRCVDKGIIFVPCHTIGFHGADQSVCLKKFRVLDGGFKVLLVLLFRCFLSLALTLWIGNKVDTVYNVFRISEFKCTRRLTSSEWSKKIFIDSVTTWKLSSMSWLEIQSCSVYNFCHCFMAASSLVVSYLTLYAASDQLSSVKIKDVSSETVWIGY